MITKVKYMICAICVICGSTSCSDMLESDSSRQVFDPALNQKTDSVFYALGILQGMQQLADQYVFQGEMRGDLVTTTDFTDNNLRQLADFSATSDNKYDSAYVYYRVINNCNYYIAHRDTMLRTGASYVTMKEYIGVKSIRAWAYMQLARTYGKVPFYTIPLTQISQIDESHFPMLDMDGIVARLAPDLEQYSGIEPSNFGGVSPASGLMPDYLFIPVDVVLGDMYLETDQWDKAAHHYITYLTEVVGVERNHTGYFQPYVSSFDLIEDERPSNWDRERNGQLRGTSRWSSVFESGGRDYITYIPMATSKLEGVASAIPLAYGYDYYANSKGYVEKIQIVPSTSFLNLTNQSSYYYITDKTTATDMYVEESKLGDMRYKSLLSSVRLKTESGSSTVRMTKNNTPRVLLYRRSAIMLRLAEAFNRLGMYDAAFGILKDGINKYLVQEDGGANYISAATRLALTTTYPLLSPSNITRFDSTACFVGVHSHGGGYTRDYTGSTYKPGLSPYQLDTIVGLKMKEIFATYGLTVDSTRQDTINAVEDLICDEYALELAFEGCRYYDLMRLARHKNTDSPVRYGANFGYAWMKKKLDGRGWDESKMYRPFK